MGGMGERAGALVAGVAGHRPELDPEAYTAPTSVVLGNVRMAAGSSVWYHAVLRGDCESITLGAGSNVQDNCSVHADLGFPVVLGERVTVGHNAVLHGCVIEDDVLVGMGSTILNGAHIGTGSLIAANALVPQGMRVPPGSLVAGMPAKVRRELTTEERDVIRLNADHYVLLAMAHRDAFADGQELEA